MNTATYNFPPVRQNDGLNSFSITLTYADGNPVTTSGAVLMQLRNTVNKVVYEFSSTATDPQKQITIISPGVFRFPTIPSWKIPAGVYSYDLQIIDISGFVKTYMAGTWTVISDISK